MRAHDGTLMSLKLSKTLNIQLTMTKKLKNAANMSHLINDLF